MQHLTALWRDSSTEQRFMEASLAYAAGKPFLSDEQFDELKRKLRKQNSRVVQQVRTLPYLGARFKGVEIWNESCTGYGLQQVVRGWVSFATPLHTTLP